MEELNEEEMRGIGGGKGGSLTQYGDDVVFDFFRKGQIKFLVRPRVKDIRIAIGDNKYFTILKKGDSRRLSSDMNGSSYIVTYKKSYLTIRTANAGNFYPRTKVLA